MNDPEKELLVLLEGAWSLEEKLKDEKLEFIRVRRPDEQLAKPTIFTDHREGSQTPIASDPTVLEGDYIALIGVQRKAKDSSISEIGTAKDDKWSMIEEVQRILREEALPAGWVWAYISRFLNRDDYGFSPPIMEEELTVLIKYTRM